MMRQLFARSIREASYEDVTMATLKIGDSISISGVHHLANYTGHIVTIETVSAAETQTYGVQVSQTGLIHILHESQLELIDRG